MPKPGPRTTYKYSEEFKATAVKLSCLPGVAIKDVAESLYIHPFMLSRWRKDAREGRIMTKGVDVNKDVAAELKALRRMNKDYERLKLEHELLKKPSRSLPNEKRHLCVHRARKRALPDQSDVRLIWRDARRLLRVAGPATE